MKAKWVVCLAVLVGGVTVVYGVTPSFQGLGRGTLPYEVAGDGSKVIGRDSAGNAAFWTSSGGWTSLGFGGYAYGISDDGSAITGWTGASQSTIGGNNAFRWTPSTGVQILPSPANQGLAISADGTTIVGAWGGGWDDRHPFRHTPAEGTIDMSTVTGMSLPGEARGVSGDGTAVTGWSDAGGWLWQSDGTVIRLKDTPPGSTFDICPWGISADGTTVVGGTVRWTMQTGIVSLGNVPGGGSREARDVSGDGSIITGYVDAPNQSAYMWDEPNGMRLLKDVLEQEYGLDLTGWQLRWAHVSDDGLTFAGAGYHPEGYDEGWVATIPEPATMSLLAVGAVALLKRKRKSCGIRRRGK
ncbi:MAG: PEP-CTERM sorting domain-containing protein [Phycisphaerae bacterium]|nr:PEP-CTERM sorting domain-containing protein [Phycisphaerae bacterium]